MNASCLSDPSIHPHNAIAELHKYLVEDLNNVNQELRKNLDLSIPLIPKVVAHILRAGGKRLRPLLALLITKLCEGENQKRAIRLAACIECIHTATLLHDDVVDDSTERRGHASANAIWGNSASVLIGDFLLSRAFEFMVEDGSLEVISTLSRATTQITKGEVIQLSHFTTLEEAEQKYFPVIEQKTASLFEATFKIGGIVADASPEQLMQLQIAGKNFGLLFQIMDDTLDYLGALETLGKNVGEDFRDGKVTFPVLCCLKKCNKAEKDFWFRTLINRDQSQGDFPRAVALLNRYLVQEDIYQYCQEMVETIKKALGSFSDNYPKRLLLDLVEYSLTRTQ